MHTPEEEKVLLAHLHELIHRGYDIRKRADFVRYEQDLRVCYDSVSEGLRQALETEDIILQPLLQTEKESTRHLQKKQAIVREESDLLRRLVKCLAFRGELESQQAKPDPPTQPSTPIPAEEKIATDIDQQLRDDIDVKLRGVSYFLTTMKKQLAKLCDPNFQELTSTDTRQASYEHPQLFCHENAVLYRSKEAAIKQWESMINHRELAIEREVHRLTAEKPSVKSVTSNSDD